MGSASKWPNNNVPSEGYHRSSAGTEVKADVTSGNLREAAGFRRDADQLSGRAGDFLVPGSGSGSFSQGRPRLGQRDGEFAGSDARRAEFASRSSAGRGHQQRKRHGRADLASK